MIASLSQLDQDVITHPVAHQIPRCAQLSDCPHPPPTSCCSQRPLDSASLPRGKGRATRGALRRPLAEDAEADAARVPDIHLEPCHHYGCQRDARRPLWGVSVIHDSSRGRTCNNASISVNIARRCVSESDDLFLYTTGEGSNTHWAAVAEAGGAQVDGRARRQRQKRPIAGRRQEHGQQVLQQGGGAVGAQVHPAGQVHRLHSNFSELRVLGHRYTPPVSCAACGSGISMVH